MTNSSRTSRGPV